MSASPITLAYLTHTFPVHSATFIVEEISAMRALGAHIKLFAIHIPKRTDIPIEFEPYARETTAVFPIRLSMLAFEHARAALGRPISYLAGLKLACWGGGHLMLRDRLRTLMHWLEAPVLYRLLSREGVRHVHVHFLFGNATVMLFVNRIYGLPFSLTAHGSDIFVEKVLQKEKIQAARFTRVMTSFNRNALESLFSPTQLSSIKLPLIPLGVEHPTQTPDFAKPEVFTFLHVGRMVWQKGQRVLLEACRILKSRGLSFRLVFVGDGELRGEIERYISKFDLTALVELRGALGKSIVSSLYKTSHCFVLSSLSEGSPAVLIEAMYDGLPVIAPRLNGIPEMFVHGREGWLFETGNAHALASAMEQAIQRSADLPAMGVRCRENAARQFDLMQNTRAFYRELQAVAS